MATVAGCWQYPVKSMQGVRRPEVVLERTGVQGDRRYGLIDEASGHLMSAKRYRDLLMATATDEGIVLPGGGPPIPYDDPSISDRLSAWLGRRVRLDVPDPDQRVSYEMTFDPPNDDADYVEIPTQRGTFVDLAHVHVVTTATLAWCRAQRPDLDWDVRRFRPNVLIDIDGPPFVEQSWVGSVVTFGGEASIGVLAPTVRCAMPLRAQPGLDAQPELFKAMTELNEESPNSLGVYAIVGRPGRVREGDPVELPSST